MMQRKPFKVSLCDPSSSQRAALTSQGGLVQVDSSVRDTAATCPAAATKMWGQGWDHMDHRLGSTTHIRQIT